MASRSSFEPGLTPLRRSGVRSRGCSATTAAGKPCHAPALRGESLCNMHHPDHGAEVAEARRLGGLHRRKEETLKEVYDLDDLGTIGGARRLLSIAALETLALP